jgi:hypothetical protein
MSYAYNHNGDSTAMCLYRKNIALARAPIIDNHGGWSDSRISMVVISSPLPPPFLFISPVLVDRICEIILISLRSVLTR